MTINAPAAHTTFTIERRLKASPKHAFRFWSDVELKGRWNGCHPDWTVEEDQFDFSITGGERKRWRTSAGEIQTFTSRYFDIIPAERIIYAYEMSFAGVRLSVSLVTILLTPEGGQTRMRYTEQVALLVGGADAGQQRLMGTEQGIDRLVEIVAADVARKH